MRPKPTMSATCRHCGETFSRRRSEVLRGLARFCSRLCSAHSVYDNPPTLEERFWPKVDRNGPIPQHAPNLGACWIWTGARHFGGYGHLVVKSLKELGRRQIKAHHASWLIHYSPIPVDSMVLHKCDNRLCIRPDHLFLGTHADNMQDMQQKGRAARGDRRPNAKATVESVLEMRRLASAGITHQKIGEQFGLTRRAVGMIVRRQTWMHVV